MQHWVSSGPNNNLFVVLLNSYFLYLCYTGAVKSLLVLYRSINLTSRKWLYAKVKENIFQILASSSFILSKFYHRSECVVWNDSYKHL